MDRDDDWTHLGGISADTNIHCDRDVLVRAKQDHDGEWWLTLGTWPCEITLYLSPQAADRIVAALTRPRRGEEVSLGGAPVAAV